MQFTTRILFLLTFLVAIAIMVVVAQFRPETLKLGMKRVEVDEFMVSVGANDISEQGIDFLSANGDGRRFWSIPDLELVIGTVYENDLLKKLVVWDWNGRDFEWTHYFNGSESVSYTHLRAHETGRNLVCRLLLEKKK